MTLKLNLIFTQIQSYLLYYSAFQACTERTTSNIKKTADYVFEPIRANTVSEPFTWSQTTAAKLKQQYQVWTDEAAVSLQDCFENTDWGVFNESGTDLEEYTSSVLAYIQFCTDAVLPTKSIKVLPNQKPWTAQQAPC